MAENFEELYSNLTSDERFKSLYPTQEEFEKALQSDPTIDTDMEDLFGVKSASEYLKKKDQSIIQNLGKENSFSLSPLGGQTEQVPQQNQTVPQQPEEMVEQPQEGVQQDLGAVEDPYGLQALGLPPLGYGKSFGGGPQPKKLDPSQGWKLTLDSQIKKAREKNDLGSLSYLLGEINKNLQFSNDFKTYYNQGKFKAEIEQINGIVADLYEKNPSAFSDKGFQDNLKKIGLINPAETNPQALNEAKKQNNPTFLPQQPGAPFIQKTTTQRLQELNTPKPADEKEKGIVEYLTAYDQERNALGYDIGYLSGQGNSLYEMGSESKSEYLTEQEKKFDKIIQGEVNSSMDNALYNLPPNFFDNPNLITEKREVTIGREGVKRTITETRQNPNRKLAFENGVYMLDDAGNPKVNPIYISNYVDRMLAKPGGIINDRVLEGFNAQRKQFGLDPYRKEDVAKILKPRYERMAKVAAEQKLESTIVERRLSDLKIYEEDVEKVNKKIDDEIFNLSKNSQKLVNDYKIEIVEESKLQVENLIGSAKKTNQTLYQNYLIGAQNAASPEIQNSLYQNYLQEVNANATRFEEQVATLRKQTEEKFKAYALEIENDAKGELELIKKNYGIISDKDENGKLTSAAYRKYKNAYKAEYNKYKSEERTNSDAMGWRLTDIAQSGSARVFANAIETISAAVGYENNPVVDLMKYLDYVQVKSEVAIRPFSEVLDTDGFFSTEALKTAVQSTVQQAPNLTLGVATTVLSGNPYVGGALMWGYETIDQVGQNYRDVFSRTGSVIQAEDAAAETLQTQILIAPIYTVSMLPFTKGFLSKIASGGNAWGFTKKFGLGLALEASEEIPVEIAQGYLQYKFGTDNPESFSNWLSKNGGNTALDVLPSIAVLGGGSAAMETYSERMTEQAKNRVLATLGRLGMSQTIADAIQVVGEGGVNILPEYLYRTQQIDINELKDMKRAFAEVIKTLPQAQELVRDQDAQRYYVSLASEKARRQRQLEESKDETQKKILEEVIKGVEKKMTDVATGKPLKLTKITFKDGGSVVVANEEMAAYLKNPIFLESISEGTIQVTTEDTEINKIVEDKKKQMEAQLQEATDKGAKNIVAAETGAREVGATINDGEKLTIIAQNATQNGQRNTDAILNESTALQTALNQIAPGASIVFLNDAEYQSTMDKVNGKKSSAGNFSYRKNQDGSYSVEIQINLDKANSTTVAHEVGHAILLATLGSDPKLFNEMRTQLKKVIDSQIDNRSLAAIDALIEKYRKIEQGEEFIVELAATLKQNEKNLEISVLEKIAKVISDFVARITGGKVQLFDKISTRVDFTKFINGMVETLRTGELSQTLKDKRNAVQEQTTSQVPVQSETTVGQEVVQGEPRSKSQETTQEGQKVVYHAGSLTNQGGNIYVTPEVQQAEAYARESGQQIQQFNIDTNTLATEQRVKEIIEELGYQSPNGTIDELMIPMLLDNRFDEYALSDKEIETVINRLKDEGFTGISFIDEDIRGIQKEGVNNYLIFDKNTLTQPQVDTQSKAQIEEKIKESKTYKIPQRYKGDVGKMIGGDLYVHSSANDILPQGALKEAESKLPQDFEYEVIKYNAADGSFSFIASPDWNTANEPIVGDAYKVKKNGDVSITKQKADPQIYHHKWNFVRDDYEGFDVQKSVQRSIDWFRDAKASINMFKIGTQSYWNENAVPLINDTKTLQRDKKEEKPTQEAKKSTDSSKILSEKLTKQELNSVRSSLRQTIPDGLAIEILDAISSGRDYDSGNEGLNDTIERVMEEGLSFRDLVNIAMQDEDLLDKKNLNNRSAVISYLLNVGELGRLQAMASRAVQKGQSQEEDMIQQEEVANFVENADETNPGIPTPVNPNQSFTSIQSKAQLGKYDEAMVDGVSFSNELPVKTLKEIAQQYDGRLFIITSDGTGYGIDSEGNPIYGGFGFVTHPQNQKDGVGFASVDVSTVKSTITAIRKFYGNQKVGVLVMIQPPYTTINNSYGAHYFIRAMKSLASDPTKLTQAKNSFKEWVMSNKGTLNNLRKENLKEGKRNTLSALFKMIDSIDANTDVNEFTKQFLEDTTFDSRKAILQGLVPDRSGLKINKSTPTIKKLLLEGGFNTENFLREYGDKTFLSDELISQDKGGFTVGGFEIDVKPEEEMDKQIEELQTKGFVHPLFNGKLPGTNHFALDGIYPINENFAKFSKPQRVFDFEKIAALFPNENIVPKEKPRKKSDVVEDVKYASEKRDELVRENFRDEKSYDEEAVQKLKNEFPPSKKINFSKDILPELGYTNLKSANKIEFKQTIGEKLGILMDKQPDVATDVARGIGFQPTESAREQLKTAEFVKGFGSKSQLTEPSSGKWSQSLTQKEVDARLAESGVRTKSENDRLLQETKKGNETQRNNISTYSAFVNGLVNKIGSQNIANVSILDAGAGFGIGAKAAANAGIASSYNTFEPFPSISDGKWEKFSGTKEPNFTDFGDVENSSQDVVVSNAVLNVVPADIRQSIVENIGRVMKPGAEAYISVRGIKESALMESLAAAKSGKSKNVFLSDSEYYVPGTQGDYQKGFSETELQAYIQDVLGSQYNVQISKEPFWKSNANAPKVLIIKNAEAAPQFKSKAQLDFTQIGPEYNSALQQNNGDKVAALTAVIEKGYTPKRIKEAIGLFDFDENAFKQAQSAIAIKTLDTIGTAFANRQDSIKQEINNNLGNVEAIYGDLIGQGYSNLEIFTAARDMDFLSPQDLVDIFGAQYRETVQRAINANTQYPADFLDELEADARTLKVSQKAGEIADVIRETGVGIVDSAVAVESLLDYLKENGFDQIAIALTNAVKQFAQDRGSFEKGMNWVDMVNSGQLGDKLYSPEAINYAFSVSSELFSQAGRILQLARFFNQTNQMAMIEKQLNQSGVVLTENQKKTLEALVNDYKAAQKDNKEKLKALEEDWSDQAYEAFNESEKAVGMATIKVAQFLEARKPIFWNERLTSGAARALLGVTTTVLSFVSNVENNIWSTNYAARTIQKLRDGLGSGIKGNTLSFSNWKLARKLTSNRMWFDMNTNAKFGVMETNRGLNRYYDNLAQINFFKDAIWTTKFMNAMVKKVLNLDFNSLTPEQQADAYDLTLVKLKDGTVELRDGKTYTFARSLAWTLGTGPALAATTGNIALLKNTGGPLVSELTGRIMSYGGDIAFGYMAAQRAMIDYFQNIQGTRYQDGIFGDMISNADGSLDEKSIRALSEILRADAELYARFEQEGLKRTLLGDNIISGAISLGRGKLRKSIRNLYTENRKKIGGSSLVAEARRELFSAKGLAKTSLQMLDVGLFTLMPFTKVPVNFLGSAMAKVVPVISGPKYIISEGIYQYKNNEFNKNYPIGAKLKSEKEKRDYEKAKIDLFSAKRQATYDAAQFVTSLAIYGFSMSAVAAGAILIDDNDDPEKEKALKQFGLRGGLYNASLHWEYIAAGRPSNFLARRGGFVKPGDKLLNTTNAGFLGYGLGLYGSVYASQRKQEANNVMSLFDTQRSALATMATSSLSSGVENLPMFQGLARIGEVINDIKKDETGKTAFNNFVSGTLSTSMAVFFPSFFSFMSKGNAEMVQSAGDINVRSENPSWPIFFNDVSLRVVQKLNRNVSFENTRNEFYEAQIGPFGEDLSYKVTVAEPGTGAAYIQAFLDPFSIRSFAAPVKEQQKEIQKYRESVDLFGSMTNLALVFEQMTGRAFEWKSDGKTTSFFNIISNPMKNQFNFEESTFIQAGAEGANVYKQFTYQLPNDLYRQELRSRGEYFRTSLRQYSQDFRDALVQVKTAVEEDRQEDAKRIITNAFESYQTAVSEANKAYVTAYKMEREKKYLIEMNKRKLFRPEEIETFKKVGLMTQSGLIP